MKLKLQYDHTNSGAMRLPVTYAINDLGAVVTHSFPGVRILEFDRNLIDSTLSQGIGRAMRAGVRVSDITE